MAYVIVSASRLTDSRMRTFRARPVLAVAGTGILLLMAACVGLGYRLARSGSLVVAAPAAAAAEVHAVVDRVGLLAGQVSRLEKETAALAVRLGTVPLAAALPDSHSLESSGGPLIPLDGIARLEADAMRLEGTLASLSGVAIGHELQSMAYPSRMPVAGSSVPVSSQFGARHDPFTGRLARHTGLDIPATHGTPILASGGGRVVVAGYKGAYGQAVVIDHGDGLATLYGHASRLLVRVGDVVLPNQKIALVGSTGRSTGAHLHFEVIRDGRRVEPRQFLARVLDRRETTGR
jgi:murein DD-endopeptidase MepM/ murein hydrolase activator NlpD